MYGTKRKPKFGKWAWGFHQVLAQVNHMNGHWKIAFYPNRSQRVYSDYPPHISILTMEEEE